MNDQVLQNAIANTKKTNNVKIMSAYSKSSSEMPNTELELPYTENQLSVDVTEVNNDVLIDDAVSPMALWLANHGLEKDEPDEVFGWTFHAAARAPLLFALTAFATPYLLQMARFSIRDSDGRVVWLGIPLLPTSYVAVAVAIGTFFAAVTFPCLGSAADVTRHHKPLMIMFNCIAGLAAILFVFVTKSTWWLGGILLPIILYCYSATLIYVYSYLPAIGKTDAQRSKLSARAVLCANSFQIGLAILAVGFIVLLSPPSLKLENGSFEDSDMSMWQFHITNQSSYTYEYTCPFEHKHQTTNNLLVSCERNNGNAERGRYSLKLTVTNDGASELLNNEVYFFQQNTQKSSVYSDHEVLYIGNCMAVDENNATSQYLLNSGNKEIIGTTKYLDSSYKIGFVRRIVDSSQLRFGVKNKWKGSYYFDDMQVFVDRFAIEPFVIAVFGIWWFIASIIAFRNLRYRHPIAPLQSRKSIFLHSARKTFRRFAGVTAPQNKEAFKLLLTISLVGAGQYGGISIISTYLLDYVRFTIPEIGLFLLSIQFVAIFGAFSCRSISLRLGLRQNYMMIVVGWLCFPILMGLLVEDESDKPIVWILGLTLGIVHGGGLMATRAFYAAYIPKGEENEFMGMYHQFAVLLTWTAPLLFAILNETMGIRYGIASMFIYFFLGLCVLLTLEKKEEEIDEESKHDIALTEMVNVEA